LDWRPLAEPSVWAAVSPGYRGHSIGTRTPGKVACYSTTVSAEAVGGGGFLSPVVCDWAGPPAGAALAGGDRSYGAVGAPLHYTPHLGAVSIVTLLDTRAAGVPGDRR